MTYVIYRRWRGGPRSPIALFPEIPADNYGQLCLSYEHIGQHGSASYSRVMARTVSASRATEDDTAALHAELLARGYDLTVRAAAYGANRVRRAAARQHGASSL